MSAPTKDEAIERVLDIPVNPDDDTSPTLGESDRVLQSIVYTGGETEYAHIYLAATTGTYNGNDMLWLRYVWLSKPGAFENDMFGDNGISVRLVDGLARELAQVVAAACTRHSKGIDTADPFYTEVR